MTLRSDPTRELGANEATHPTNGHSAHSREALERRANLVLGELLRRLDVLDERRQQLKNAGAIVKYEVKRHLPLAALLGAGALALGVLVARIARARREREFRRQVTRALLGRIVGGDVVEPQTKPSAIGTTLRAAGIRLLLLAGSEIGRRVLAQAMEARNAQQPRLLGPRSV